MRIEFTVRGPTGSRDVAVTTASTTPLGDVLPALAEVVGAAPQQPAWCDAHRLSGPDETIAGCGLRTGAVVSFGSAPPGALAGLRAVRVVGGTVAGDPVPLRRDGLVVGRDPACEVVLVDDRSSRRHARLRAGPAGVTVHDLGTTNGTTVDGVSVPAEGAVVRPGALIRVGDSLLAVNPAEAPAAAALMRGTDGALQVNRAPRTYRPDPAVIIERGEPTRVAPPGRVQWFAALTPAVAGGLLAWVLSSPVFLLVALLSPVLLLGTAVGDRWHWRRQRRRADLAARRSRHAVDEQITRALHAETARRRTMLPDPWSVLQTATRPGRRLWERETGDPDHLVVRVGSADVESEATVRETIGSHPAGLVPMVPVAVELRAGPLGIAGPGPAVDEVARWLVGQLAVSHAPSGLTLVVVASGRPDDEWSWCRWLPHLQVAPSTGPAAALATLAALRDRRRELALSRPASPWTGRWTVVVADRLRGSDAAALADVLADGARYGITAICLADTESALAASCRSVVRADTGSACRLRVRRGADDVTVLADRVTPDWAERVARALAPFTDARSGAALPTTCRWGDLVPAADADSIRGAWADSDGGARVAVGLTRDGPLVVDLLADGPHALVAGTTGSGKSELLRTLVVGLAAACPPSDLTFLLIDYKGGAAFAEATRLPHTTGVLTDLDATQTARALTSLDAELRRREQLFATAGTDDLAAYRRWMRARPGGTPVARLVIVVDEFAELADDLPSFVTGLIGVARRGRSLGVHLVLATQRPGSAVSAEIRANTALRIALRVTEPVESTDVIGLPDAALLDPGTPGRALARIGGRVVEMQTARIVADPTVSRPVVEVLGAWRRPEPGTRLVASDDELRRVVGLIDLAARQRGSPAPHVPWLPPLPERMTLSSLGDPDVVPLGRLDRPADQTQPVFGLDPAGDSMLIVGRARSGRTTVLITAALAATRRAAPETLQLHVVDGRGPLVDILAQLPHLGTTVTRDGVEVLPRLLDRLAARSSPTVGTPRSLLLVDDWDLLVGHRDDALSAHWTDLLAAVVRTVGPELSVLVAGGRSLLLPRLAGGFGSRLVLPLADPNDYGTAGLPSSAVPATPAAGSGVRAPDGTPFRIAHTGSAPTPEAARAAVVQVTRRWAGHRRAVGGVRLRPLPARVALDALRGSHPGMVLGLAGDAASPCVVDVVARRAHLLVAGPARSGRSTTLMTVASEARRVGHTVAVVAATRSPLREHARSIGAQLVDSLPDEPPRRPTLLVVDDVEACDERLTDGLAAWLRDPAVPVGAVVAGRHDELATSFRGLVTEVRRDRCGVLLRPGVLDGELLGVRLRPAVGPSPPGRGVVVGDPRWGTVFAEADAVPIQVAHP